MKKGFTLIELLVVVLIIGVLSAMALPQYQRTVLRSRTAEAWTNLKAIDTAIDSYCLANPTVNGDFNTIRDQLDIQVKDTDTFAYSGQVSCSNYKSSYVYMHYIYATYQQGANFQLAIHPKTGARSCKGSDCKKIGFTKSDNLASVCLCGGFTTNNCYYE